MDIDTYEDIVRLLTLGSYAARSLGLIVLGLGTGWFSLYAFRKSKGAWQVKMAAIFGFIALAAVSTRFLSPGAVGSFAVGSGAGLLMWGLRRDDEEDKD